MRAILIFPLLLNAIYVGCVNADVVCPTNVSKSVKHAWKVEEFLRRWSGDELYSHSNETFDDTCLRVKITEKSQTADDANLEIKFDYPDIDLMYSVNVKKSNTQFWIGENFTVQALSLKDKRLLLNICDTTKGKFSVLLKEDDSVPDVKDDKNEEMLIKTLFSFKGEQFKIHSTADLNLNCTAVEEKADYKEEKADSEEENSSAGNNQFTFMTIWILIFSRLLLL